MLPERQSEVPPLDSLKFHLATEVANRKQSESELWHSYSRLADCYESLVLQFAWMRRRQWILLSVAFGGQLFSWLLGTLVVKALWS
jgi:hypothetical protein